MTSSKFWPVSTCITGNGTGAGPERLARQVQHDDRVLAAGEQQPGLLDRRRDLAEDVHGLGLELVEVGQLVGGAGHRSSRRSFSVTGLGSAERVVERPVDATNPAPGCFPSARRPSLRAIRGRTAGRPTVADVLAIANLGTEASYRLD